MSHVYIVDAVRTPVGKAVRGVFKNTLPDDLLTRTIDALHARHADFDWNELGDVVVGCAMPEAEQGMNVARIATLLSQLPSSVPAMTVNRLCASGLQSIASAVAAIRSGHMSCALAGGVESMSMVPLGGHHYTMNPRVFHDDEHVGIAYGMGLTAEKVATRWKITKEAQDNFAAESHRRAVAAIARGDFTAEIIPFNVTERHMDITHGHVMSTYQMIRDDEGPRADTSYEAIARLKPVFALKGSVTAGNSSQISDGAAMTMLANEDIVQRYGLKPLGRLLSFAVAGVPPEVMGIGPIRAIPLALKQAGIRLDDLDWIELNEAFAAQALAVIQELNLPQDKVNPLGGAIALGHPLGATGSIRVATLLHGLRRTQGRYGMVTMCIGTGMGAAAIFEAL